MKTLVDDLSVLAVEKGLLKPLPDLLSPQTVISLDDTTVAKIAAETEESRLERLHAEEKLKVLEHSLKVLRSLDRHKAARESPSSYKLRPARKSADWPFLTSSSESKSHVAIQPAGERANPGIQLAKGRAESGIYYAKWRAD